MYRISVPAVPAIFGKCGSSKIFAWIFGLGGFQHSCNAHALFTAVSKETTLCLSSLE